MAKRKLKLWQKYLVGAGAVGTLVGSVTTGIYAFSKSDSAQGPAHLSLETLRMRMEDLNEVSKYEMTFRDPINTNTVIGKYEFSEHTEGKVDGKYANAWVEEYYKKHGTSPVMTIVAGGIKFNNYYSEAILPKDFVKFVLWFSKNISWSPGLTSITSYTLKKGVEKDGSSIKLGSYSAVLGESKQIKFMPDSFYGLKSFSSLVEKEIGGLTKEGVKQYINLINKINPAIKDVKAKRYIYSVEKGDDGLYSIYTTKMKYEGIVAANKMYSSKRVVSDLNVTTDEYGVVTMKDEPSYKVPHAAEISRLELVRAFAAPKKWKGIGIGFLKYVTTHEYGHMQTLSMTQDGSTNPVGLGPSTNLSPVVGNPSGSVDLETLNNYLAARIPMLRAVAVSPLLKETTPGHYEYEKYDDAVAHAKANNLPLPSRHDYASVAFEYTSATSPTTFQLLNVDKIFGEGKFSDPTDTNSLLYNHDSTDPSFQAYLQEMTGILKTALDSKKGFKLQFLMRNVQDLDLFAKFLGIPKYALMFINANDNLKSTVSPSVGVDDLSIDKPAYWGKEMDENGEWVADNMFNLLIPGTTDKYFKEASVSDTPLIISPYTKKKYILTAAAQTKFINDGLSKVAFEDALALAFKIGLDDKTIKHASPDDFDDNDRLALQTALIKAKQQLAYQATSAPFIKWFEDVMLIQDIRYINGNEMMHSFLKDKTALVNSPFSLVSAANISGELTESWNALNDFDAVSDEDYSHFQYDYGKGAHAVKKIKAFDVNNAGQLASDLETYISTIGGITTPHESVSVFAGKRYTGMTYSGITEDNGYARTNTFSISLYELLHAQTPSDMSQLHLNGQKLFALNANDTTKPFVLLDASGNEIRIADETAYAAMNDDQKDAAVKTLLDSGTQFKWNNQLQFGLPNSKDKPFNLNGATFNVMPLTDLFKIISLDPDVNNIKAEQSITIQGIESMHYASFSDSIADTFIQSAGTSTDLKDAMRLYSHHYLVKGYKDAKMTPESLADLAQKILKVGNLNYNIYKGLFGKNLQLVAGSTYETFSVDRAVKYFTDIRDSDKSSFAGDNSVNTLMAWQQLLMGKQALKMLINEPISTFEILMKVPYIEAFKGQAIQEWIANINEGYVSTLSQVFSNYTSQLAEVLTRDWVQMTYSPDMGTSEDEAFRYQNAYATLTERNTGFDLYINPSAALPDDSIVHDFESLTTQDKQLAFLRGYQTFDQALWNNIKEGAKNGKITRDLMYAVVVKLLKYNGYYEQFGPQLVGKDISFLVQVFEVAKLGTVTLTNDNYLQEKIDYLNEMMTIGSGTEGTLFGEYYVNNGFYKDRWLREMFISQSESQSTGANGDEDWKLYDDHGDAITDSKIRLHSAKYDATTHQIQDAAITSRPEAFWWYLLKSYGTGDRSVAGLWRNPERDAMSMWGVLPSEIADKVKFIKATSKSGEVKYIPVRTKDTNNLFYLTKQADASSKHTLEDDGYKTWEVDLLTLGTWRDSILQNGEWKLEFVDESKTGVKWVDGVHNAFTTGTKGLITENNKDKSYAPVYIEERDGASYMTVQDQFAI